MLTNLFLGQTAEEKNFIEDLFSCYLYTGNGSTQTITNGIDLTGKGGLVWIKARDWASSHSLNDTARGTLKWLGSNDTLGQQNQSNGYGAVSAYNATGFSLNTTYNETNGSGINYASWTFRKAPKFFDVVTYTGNGASSRDINHSLGVRAGLIFVKAVSATGRWPGSARLNDTSWTSICLNTTESGIDAYYNGSGYVFSLSDTQFRVATNGVGIADVNANGVTYVAYLFAHDATADGVIQCGSFTKDGSGNADITLGWEPQWVLLKTTNGSSGVGDNWLMADIMRGANYSNTPYMYANGSNAEMTNGGAWLVPTANGFQIRGLSGASNHIYLAIRRGPMRVPTDATKVFSPISVNASAGTKQTTGFPIDTQFIKIKDTTDSNVLFDRVRGVSTNTTNAGVALITNSTAAEYTSGVERTRGWDNTGFLIDSYYASRNVIYQNFARAPGFFDVVCYTGTGSARTVSHNLGVAPELMIVKRRDTTADWQVYAGAAGEYLVLNTTAAKVSSNSDRWNNTTPTSSVFSLGTNAVVNASGGTYVAYLFATCAGVSKVGTYTGTGTTKQIDCGFTNGARFVLIKRTDSTGDWTVWDTARGIVSGNDPYLLLNSTAAEVTNTDYIDPLSTGFEISSTAPAAINANGGTFVFLAIA